MRVLNATLAFLLQTGCSCEVTVTQISTFSTSTKTYMIKYSLIFKLFVNAKHHKGGQSFLVLLNTYHVSPRTRSGLFVDIANWRRSNPRKSNTAKVTETGTLIYTHPFPSPPLLPPAPSPWNRFGLQGGTDVNVAPSQHIQYSISLKPRMQSQDLLAPPQPFTFF